MNIATVSDALGRLWEMPYLLRPPNHPRSLTWSITEEERRSISIAWPMHYQWNGCAVIIETIKDALERSGTLREENTLQVYRGVVMLRCTIGGQEHGVVLDYSDYHHEINRPALKRCSLYFKLQYRSGGYADARILPGGYPVTFRKYYRFYLSFRYHGNRRPSFNIVGRFGYTFQGEIRRRAVGILCADPRLGFVGAGGKVRYPRFMHECADSKLALHMPGNGPFTHRVAEYLGLGTCVVSPQFATELHVPLLPGVHYVAVNDDLSDLLDKVRFYLSHDAERNRIAAAGKEYFDKYLHADHLASYYLRTMLERLAERSRPSELPAATADLPAEPTRRMLP
jgi:hypothetical protein